MPQNRELTIRLNLLITKLNLSDIVRIKNGSINTNLKIVVAPSHTAIFLCDDFAKNLINIVPQPSYYLALRRHRFDFT